MARHPITLIQLKQRLPKHAASPPSEDIDTVLNDLEKLKLVLVEDKSIRSISNEMKFPKPENAQQKKFYEQIDLWNLQFHKEMRFELVLEKMMLRRVSARYLSVIESHCNVLLELIRASDELEASHNDDVLMFNLTLQKGQLPG